MTEAAPGVSELLSGATPPAEPVSPSREQAFARLDAMQRSPAFAELLIRNDPAARAELKAVRDVVNTPTGLRMFERPDSIETGRESVVNTWSNFADLPPEVLQQVRERRPVSADEFKLAQAERKRLMADREFVKKYFDGDRDARRRMSLVSIILGSEIKPA